jgi:hypothetical protein
LPLTQKERAGKARQRQEDKETLTAVFFALPDEAGGSVDAAVVLADLIDALLKLRKSRPQF